MKTYLSMLALAVLSITSCTTPQGVTGVYRDDVYVSSADAAAEKAEKQKQKEEENKQRAVEAKRAEQARNSAHNNAPVTEDYYQPSNPNSNALSTTSESTTDGNGNTYITNNYYDDVYDHDDYYDYGYAARIKRFHNNVGSYGYYDSYYTNSYWYSNNPWNYGTSIYLGYSFWGPSYNVYSYNPANYWYSSMGWGCDPWYSPFGCQPYYGYSPYWGYNPYMYGYMNGYNNGFYNGYYNGNAYNNNYFNSYDNNSYYGPRKTLSANSKITSQPVLSRRYMAAVEKETNKPFDETKGRMNNPYIRTTDAKNNSDQPVPAGYRGSENTNSRPRVITNGNNNANPDNNGNTPAGTGNTPPTENKTNNRTVNPVNQPAQDRPVINGFGTPGGNNNAPANNGGNNRPGKVDPKAGNDANPGRNNPAQGNMPAGNTPPVNAQPQPQPAVTPRRNVQPKYQQQNEQPRYQQQPRNVQPAPSQPAPSNSQPRNNSGNNNPGRRR